MNTTKATGEHSQATTKTTIFTPTQEKNTMQPKTTKHKKDDKRRQTPKPNESFVSKSRAAALQQTKLQMEKESHQNRSFLRIDGE